MSGVIFYRLTGNMLIYPSESFIAVAFVSYFREMKYSIRFMAEFVISRLTSKAFLEEKGWSSANSSDHKIEERSRLQQHKSVRQSAKIRKRYKLSSLGVCKR